MYENVSIAETDPTQSTGPMGHMKKWSGRLVLGGIVAIYGRETARWFKGNSLFRKIEEVIHHEHQETPEDEQL